MLIEIKSDPLDIWRRILEIDRRYKLFYNTIQRRYEVRVDGKIPVVLPFDALDARTVEYLLKTRVENLEKLTAEIDRQNAELEAAREREQKDIADYKAKSLFSYLNRSNAFVPDYHDI